MLQNNTEGHRHYKLPSFTSKSNAHSTVGHKQEEFTQSRRRARSLLSFKDIKVFTRCSLHFEGFSISQKWRIPL